MKTQNPIQTFMLHVSPSHLSNPQTPFPLAPGMLRRFTLIQLVSPQATPLEQKKKESRLRSGILQNLKFHEIKSFSQKGGVMCSYTTWKVDGATPMYWCIMASY